MRVAAPFRYSPSWAALFRLLGRLEGVEEWLFDISDHSCEDEVVGFKDITRENKMKWFVKDYLWKSTELGEEWDEYLEIIRKGMEYIETAWADGGKGKWKRPVVRLGTFLYRAPTEKSMFRSESSTRDKGRRNARAHRRN